MTGEPIQVVKRKGSKENFNRDKFAASVFRMTYGLDNLSGEDITAFIVLPVVTECLSSTSTRSADIVQKTERHILSAAASEARLENSFSKLAARLKADRLHKEIPKIPFSRFMMRAYDMCEGGTPTLRAFVRANQRVLDSNIIHARDFEFTSNVISAVETRLLRGTTGCLIERPQHWIMRLACMKHTDDIEAALKCYNETPVLRQNPV